MTKSEMNRFRAILTAKVAELVRFTRHRDGIGLSEAPINWTRTRRLRNAHSRFVTSHRCGGPRLGEARAGRHSESLYRRAPRLDGYT
jgi:hypothetical protein